MCVHNLYEKQCVCVFVAESMYAGKWKGRSVLHPCVHIERPKRSHSVSSSVILNLII